MLSRQSLIDDLESAIANGEIGRRAESLRRVTDLFVSGAAQYNDEQIALFDDVMGRLASEIESSARSTFGQRLMTVPNAPPGIIRTEAGSSNARSTYRSHRIHRLSSSQGTAPVETPGIAITRPRLKSAREDRGLRNVAP